ncbi:MAG: hypothetical protein HW390_3634 [Candidatus Brocadiaceae bacterium]|nr:hypothetical protein [Candidatus Brocadiaceae bacterium]
MEPLVEKAADPSLSQSIRRRISPDVKKVSTLEDLLVVCPDFAEVVTDATEQQRRRPKKRIQKKYYSGKKKRHTIKTQITEPMTITSLNRRIRLKSCLRKVPIMAIADTMALQMTTLNIRL